MLNLVFFFIFTLPLSQFVSARLLVLTCLLSLFLNDSLDVKGRISLIFRNSWDVLFYFLILLAGLLYTTDLKAGGQILETNLSLVAIPVIFSRVAVDDLKSVFLCFVAGLFLACSICLVNASVGYFKTYDVSSFFFYNLTDVLNFQPTYFAYYLIFAITYGLYLLYYQQLKINSIVVLTGILFFFITLMLTGGETSFVSMLLILSFFILKFIVEEKNHSKRLVTGFVSLLLVGMFAATLIGREEEANDAWDRLFLWESAIKATPNPILGVGTGDYKSVLNQYFMNNQMEKFAIDNYNSHNQYIQSVFVNGLPGVLALLIMMVRPLYMASKNNNILTILSLFPFLIYGITEVFLGRYQGIVFFVFIHQFFMIQLNSNKQLTFGSIST